VFRDSVEVTADSVEEAKRLALEMLEADGAEGVDFEVLGEDPATGSVRLRAVRQDEGFGRVGREMPQSLPEAPARGGRRTRRTRLRPGSPSRPWPKPELVIESAPEAKPITQMGIAPSRAKEREAYEPTPEHDAAVEACTREVLDAMELPYEVDFEHADYQRIFVTVPEEEAGALIGRRGSGVDALELIMGRIVGQRCHGNVPVQLDVNGYREREHEKLEDRAREAAGKVRRDGDEFHFEPMNPRDRRVIHLAVESMEDLTTFTVGEGSRRHVVVALRPEE
jgi:spoIIIJ-associated protein